MVYRPIKTVFDFKNNIFFNETTETLYWDFKDQVNLAKLEDTAIDISAFANSMGGSLLIGISESINNQGLRVACGINPSLNIEQTKSCLSNAIRDKIKPYVQFEISCIPLEKNKVIISVNIEPSVNLLGVCLNLDRKSFCYPYRTDFGNRFFEFYQTEIRMHQNRSRANFLRLHSLIQNVEVLTPVELYPIPRGIADNDLIQIKLLKEPNNIFELHINSWIINLPFSMIEEIWNRSNVGCKIVLKLREKLYKHSNGIDFDYPEIRHRHETPGMFMV